jgi:hypothetical protein
VGASLRLKDHHGSVGVGGCHWNGGAGDGRARDPVGGSEMGDIGGISASDLHRASLFISADPRNPRNALLTLAACLLGAWIVSPAIFLGSQGACVKYLCGLQTKRVIWVSTSFCNTFPRAWALILEIVNARKPKWKFLGSAHEWAAARADAERKGKPAEVLSLVGPAELDPALKHTFALDGLISFIAHPDPDKGSIGLLNM